MNSFYNHLLLKILRDNPSPIWSDYACGVEVFRHWQAFHQEDISIKELSSVYRDLIKTYIEQQIFLTDTELPSTLFRAQARQRTNPDEALCAADPFAYLSHLSAMVYHGLSNRLPTTLFYTTFPESHWRVEAQNTMKSELREDFSLYLQSRLPRLTFPSLSLMQGLHLHRLGSKDRGGYRHARDGSLRVAKIGRTFLDMLQEPKACGGIYHVLEVYEEHAEYHLTAIVDALELHGRKIDKVRAGYILEERCGIQDTRVNNWLAYARRGSAQKLNALEPYSPNYSERWMLSINV